MTSISVICQSCHQTFDVEVDEEGLKFIGEERLKRMARCDRCVDLQRSKERSEYFARTQTTKPGQPF